MRSIPTCPTFKPERPARQAAHLTHRPGRTAEVRPGEVLPYDSCQIARRLGRIATGRRRPGELIRTRIWGHASLTNLAIKIRCRKTIGIASAKGSGGRR